MARGAPQRRASRFGVQKAPRAMRRAKEVVSYREPSSEIGEEPEDTVIAAESDESQDEGLPSTLSPRSGKASKQSTSKRRQPSSSLSPALSDSSQILFDRPAKRRATRKQMPPTPPHSTTAAFHNEDQYSAGIIPPWNSLPYHVLVQIFHYASYPLYDERNFQPTSSIDWLLKASRLCRSFAEPALTILHKSPPLVPMERAHKLRQLLAADPSPMTYNYRVKVERLQIEVSQTATYTLPGYGLLDLYLLIRNCPRLSDLEIYHQKDLAPYRDLDDTIKFTYPTSLFAALDETSIKLRSWRWNSRIAGNHGSIDKLRDIHLTPSFIGLRNLCFVNYQQFQPRKNVEDPQHETKLAEGLSVLPNLECLVFESSSLLNAKLLALLPRNLKHLEFINCWELISEDMASFLVTHGHHLRSLTLNHNQSLSLSFLQVLGSACRHLTVLKMNLMYYNTHMTYRDSEPLYEKLLYASEVPQWPSSLQELELTHLRNWDIDAAEMFFQSIVDSAATLQDFRRIVIRATLNTSWRDRVKFRDFWVPTLIRVFKRPYIAPNQHLRSLGAFSAFKKVNDNAQDRYLVEENKQDSSTSDQTRKPIRAFRTPGDDSGEDEGASIEYLQERNCKPRGTRRSARLISARLIPVNSLQSPTHADIGTSQREIRRRRVVACELATLQQTAGMKQLKGGIASKRSANAEEISTDEGNEVSDSDDEPLVTRVQNRRGQRREFIQGMCDVVSITVDNLRPTEKQFVEADFLDSEPEGDEDWDGT